MQIVQAFEDNNGRLWKTKRDAVESDFSAMVQKAWRKMAGSDLGDPAEIARALSGNIYPTAREALFEALLYLEEHLKQD